MVFLAASLSKSTLNLLVLKDCGIGRTSKTHPTGGFLNAGSFHLSFPDFAARTRGSSNSGILHGRSIFHKKAKGPPLTLVSRIPPSGRSIVHRSRSHQILLTSHPDPTSHPHPHPTRPHPTVAKGILPDLTHPSPPPPGAAALSGSPCPQQPPGRVPPGGRGQPLGMGMPLGHILPPLEGIRIHIACLWLCTCFFVLNVSICIYIYIYIYIYIWYPPPPHGPWFGAVDLYFPVFYTSFCFLDLCQNWGEGRTCI